MSVDQVMAGADGMRAWQEDFYRDLHQHPELSHQEHRTAGLVADRLRQSGFEVTAGVGGTGVVGVLRNGEGPAVLLRADMDALPVKEDTGLPYASTATGIPIDGDAEVAVMHACGHDMHTACLIGGAHLLAQGQKHWRGTLITVFQPAEEMINGAKGMVDDGLASLTGPVDVALGQHVMPLPAGCLAAIPGPAFAGGASIRVTVYGCGGHASMPQSTIDPVVLAAAIVLRLQSVVAREIEPGEPAILTVGSLHAGTKANIIPDQAELLINIRFYSEETRSTLLGSIRRIIIAECAASGSPRDPDIEVYEEAPLTVNDAEVTAQVAAALAGALGPEAMITPPRIGGSEDFSDIARGVNAPYCFWLLGGTDADAWHAAEAAGRIASDIPVNHSPHYAPVIQPTLDIGTEALVAATLAWLGQ
ncbi:MAG: amidohydrolase [Mycobacterium sp.]